MADGAVSFGRDGEFPPAGTLLDELLPPFWSWLSPNLSFKGLEPVELAVEIVDPRELFCSREFNLLVSQHRVLPMTALDRSTAARDLGCPTAR